MNSPPVSAATIKAIVGDALNRGVASSVPLAGGDVASSFRVELDDGSRVFAKTHADPPPGFFSTEAAGLTWLGEVGAIDVPTVVAVCDEPPLLVLEWIDEGRGQPADEEAFGRSLAALHRAGAPSFGRADRRTTGSRALPNEPCETWAEFFASQRLEPLARIANDTAALDPQVIDAIGALATRLDDVGGPVEPAARLHGDLWAGNRIVDRTGRSWLIDPACHGGHREFDLAMMRLFGGFGPGAFAAYDEAFPLADGWRSRVPLHQLAPLIVHAIKFGGGYAKATADAMEAIVAIDRAR